MNFTDITQQVDQFVEVLKKKHSDEKVIAFMAGMIASLVALVMTNNQAKVKLLLENILKIK